MNTIHTIPAAAEKSPSSVTVGTSALLEHEEVLALRDEDLLSESNREDSDETHVYHINGGSNAVRIKADQFRLAFPPLPQAQEFFQALQKWEGHVIEVGKETFRARLVPIVGEGGDQDAEVYIEEVARDDRSLITPGAVFYWSIGYLDRPSGRLRASILRFRRLPVWTKRDLKSADIGAARLRTLLNAE